MISLKQRKILKELCSIIYLFSKFQNIYNQPSEADSISVKIGSIENTLNKINNLHSKMEQMVNLIDIHNVSSLNSSKSI